MADLTHELERIWEDLQKPGSPGSPERSALIEKGLNLAQSVGDPLWRLRISGKQVRSLFAQGRLHEARKLCAESWWEARKGGLTEGLVICHHEMFVCRHSQGDFRRGLVHAQRAFSLSTGLKNDDLHAKSCLYLGSAFSRLGDLEKAQAYMEECLQIADQLKNPSLTGIANINLGILFGDMNMCEAAQTHFREALPDLERAGDLINFGTAQLNLAEAVARQERNEEALVICKEAGEFIERENLTSLLILQKVKLAELNTKLGNLDEASTAVDRASDLLNDFQSEQYGYDIAMCRMEIEFKRGQYTKALNRGRELEHRVKQGGNHARITRTLRFISECQEKLGQFEQAYASLKESESLSRELQERNDRTRMQNLSIAHEVSKKERKIQKLDMARRLAEEGTRAKQEFLATMTHDLRSPLNAILGLSELLATTELTDEQKEYVEGYQQAGELMLSLVNDLLDFAKLEEGRLQLEVEPTNPRDLIRSCFELFKMQFEQKGIAYQFESGSGIPVTLLLDPKRLKQVVLNLLSNAFKYTRAGSVHVRLMCSERRDALEIHVEDTGVGIPGNAIENLFESFTRVKSEENKYIVGSGLGLSIVRQLTELMGGEVAVESEPGKGSCFRVRIPMVLCDGKV